MESVSEPVIHTHTSAFHVLFPLGVYTLHTNILLTTCVRVIHVPISYQSTEGFDWHRGQIVIACSRKWLPSLYLCKY